MKKLVTSITAAVMLLSACVPSISKAGNIDDDVFYDDFSGDTLNSDNWLVAEKNWGGTISEAGVTKDYNGGVIHDNVSVNDGKLILTGYGNEYNGDIRGINRDLSQREDGKRCGGAIATRDYFGSGSYEIYAKISPELGCCSAMWTFEYEEDYSDGDLKVVNHEIDIEFPGRDSNDDFSLSHVLCTTWLSEDDYKTKTVFCGDQADGQFHKYRFDWHTGSETETPRVEYYFDDELIYTAYDFIPTNESRLWLGLWFPKNWAGTPDFEKTDFEIDHIRITPFHESGDTPQHESYPDSGWYETAELPKGWLLWHSYTSYSALDSSLWLRSPDGKVSAISGDFIHAMNGSFGISPDMITFMAIDKNTDEWDIFVSENGIVTNLTEKSGFRNEDPKWSPDGKSIVFKRGHWDSSADSFVYDLAVIDVKTREIKLLTSDPAEEAMPCFSQDGNYIFYTSYSDGIGSICRLELSSIKSETIYSENGVTAYYPVTSGDKVFFTKWYSADNRCDQIVYTDGRKIQTLPFDSQKYDCSDACPVGEDKIIFSSTMNGDYDLYYYNGKRTAPVTELNSDKNELGADFFACDDSEQNTVCGDVNMDGKLNVSDLVLLQEWLSGVPDTLLKDPDAANLCQDSRLDVFDLCAMRNELKTTPHKT